MNAVISLCHFCELHGPSVLFSTQAFHETDSQPHVETPVEGAVPKSCYGNLASLREGTMVKVLHNTCEACQSLHPKQLGFISNDHEGHISYLSTQQVIQIDVATLVRQACFRSLSCEVSPGKEGPVFFGDEVRGHVLSYTFFLKDAQARGFHRWYSIVVLMRDKLFLLNSWPFLVDNLRTLIAELQTKASKVYDCEQAQCPQRAMRLCPDISTYKQQNPNKTSRSLIELTADHNVFAQLHWWFTWLLKAGADRLVERVTEALPGQGLARAWDQWQYEVAESGEEEGFTLVSASENHSPMHELEASASIELDQVVPAVSSARQLRLVLGPQQFLTLAFCLMSGRQVVVRGQPHQLVTSIIKSLKVLVPRSCYRAIPHSDQYMDPSQCNLLGLEPWVAAPQPSAAVLRLDILPPEDITRGHDLHSYSYKLTWGGKLPAKCPTVLLKMEKAMENPKMGDSVMHYHFVALKEEWLNIAKVLHRVQQSSSQPQDLTNLLQALGAQEQDRAVLEFWATGIL